MYDRFSSLQREFQYTDCVASTNAALRDVVLKTGRPWFGVLCADRQTGGIGRQGRSFFSPAGGIYFSAVYPFTGKEAHLPFFSLLAGLQVCKTLERFSSVPLQIKWPNDLWLNGKKVCGILAQTVFVENAPVAILGVGINAALPAEEIPAELKNIMTSFFAEGVCLPEKKEIVKNIVAALDAEVYQRQALCGDLSGYIDEIGRRNALLNKRVTRVLPRGTVGGVALGLSEDGGLLIRTDAGETEEITCGEVLPESAVTTGGEQNPPSFR